MGPPRTVVQGRAAQEVDLVHLFLAAGHMAGWKAQPLFRLVAALRGWG